MVIAFTVGGVMNLGKPQLDPNFGVEGQRDGKFREGKLYWHVEYLLLRVMCVLMHVHVLVGVNVSVIMCILVWIRVFVAPPIFVGAWPMAGMLWRLFEYYQWLDSVPSFILWIIIIII